MTQNIFFTVESMSPFHGLSFWLRLVVANRYVDHFKRFFFPTKMCFSIHITYSSVNFTWFTLFSQQKFDDRLLFKSVWFAIILNNLKANIFMRWKWFWLETNSKQRRVYIYGYKIWKKKIFYFYLKKKIPLIYWMTLLFTGLIFHLSSLSILTFNVHFIFSFSLSLSFLLSLYFLSPPPLSVPSLSLFLSSLCAISLSSTPLSVPFLSPPLLSLCHFSLLHSSLCAISLSPPLLSLCHLSLLLSSLCAISLSSSPLTPPLCAISRSPPLCAISRSPPLCAISRSPPPYVPSFSLSPPPHSVPSLSPPPRSVPSLPSLAHSVPSFSICTFFLRFLSPLLPPSVPSLSLSTFFCFNHWQFLNKQWLHSPCYDLYLGCSIYIIYPCFCLVFPLLYTVCSWIYVWVSLFINMEVFRYII